MVLVSDIGILPLAYYLSYLSYQKKRRDSIPIAFFWWIMVRFSAVFAVGFASRKDLKITVDN